ncbi:hypothetical protein [Cryptosporangium sp. NPDC048952]|uniref:hypothetical protein n=1 Tax=Cryptosporangium sp. NPDC048952 TaxID=3363961 RepID=UPI0037166A48
MLAVADEVGATAAQVSLAWLRHRAALATTALVPIVGPRTPARGTPHEDVAAALSSGADGDRTLLEPHPVPVV